MCDAGAVEPVRRHVDSPSVLVSDSHRPGVGQWLGAAAVLLIAGFYALALPVLSAWVVGDGELVAGEPYEVVPGLEILPVEGWKVGSVGDTLVSLVKDGAELVFSSVGPRDDVHRVMERTVAGLENDPNNDWEVGEIQAFTTDVGDKGWSVLAFSATTAQEYWIITGGDRQVTIVGSSPDSVWPTVADEMDEMVSSAVFLGAGG